ncbi:PREDICTED: fms-related tyrosine kinase 3 ligand [Gekko japonicus]|uniref:Fms-related tyrosine kinase 3 ligand n=1 Tax=Gekko japonicus TaxID=146911 RepID=A0ABM1KK06_GEKJA|nr:PREDICTED: fms-related tyrosine kinase 3 ligand [Gekko japonicus]
MSRCHGIPDACVVSLLLFLCFTHSGLGENCTFTHTVFPTTDVSTDGLRKLLLWDYPVSMPGNLKPDEHCFRLWQLHFISSELSRMLQVAGSELSKHIAKLEEDLGVKELFESCKIESSCVEFERTNVSMFLDSIPLAFEAVRDKMELMGMPFSFSNCTPIQCHPESRSTPYPGYSKQVLEDTQASKSAVLQRHHWFLIPIPLLACLFSIVKLSGRVPFQPLPLQV